jgi:hypothetical protein
MSKWAAPGGFTEDSIFANGSYFRLVDGYIETPTSALGLEEVEASLIEQQFTKVEE